jgi:hypothetical protein
MKCPLSGCSSPLTVASGQDEPANLVVSGPNLYWSVSAAAIGPGAVMTCPTAGCPDAGPVTFAAQQHGAFALAADETHMYFTLLTVTGAVMACPLNDCSNPIALATDQNLPTVIALDAVSVYWMNYDSIMRVAKP